MKRILYHVWTVTVLVSVLTSCTQKQVLENNTQRYKDYKKLEDTLTQTKSFPGQKLQERYDQFLKDYGWTGDITKLPDGVYKAYSTPDAYGYIHYVRFEIKSGRMVDIFYDEFIPGAAIGKREDAEYSETMSRLTKSTSAEAYPLFEKQMLEVQDPLKYDVDTVSGATLSSWRFRIVVLKAISEFKTGNILSKEFYSWKENS
jgi:major membrane immunogen (membrane-anchored lipoprotein)